MTNSYCVPELKSSEIVFGLVGAVGCNMNNVVNIVKDKLLQFNYEIEEIKISEAILKGFLTKEQKSLLQTSSDKEYHRITTYMDIGNELRSKHNPEFLAMAVAYELWKKRKNEVPRERVAYVINSLKHPEEVKLLRSIYGSGFYLFGVYEDEQRREKHLADKGISTDYAKELISRDENENVSHGQQTRDTFQLADFFVDCGSDNNKTTANIHRIVDLIFGEPFITPTFGEYAMFQAFSASLRSADLSRQIGAVICRDNEIIASGANDCPKYGGGLYWHHYDDEKQKYVDDAEGRDYLRGLDSNKKEFRNIAEDVLTAMGKKKTDANIDKLRKTKLGDLTEYGRIVHAEMEALSMCARNNISCRGGTLYSITFPCHNCAKHLISAGIKEVFYIEAYPKSKAFAFYSDSVSKDDKDRNKKVVFAPFLGVGPRRFIEMFSVTYGNLYDKVRKDKAGNVVTWTRNEAAVRSQVLATNYLERESMYAAGYFSKITPVKED